jgi:hypothetical protein
MKEVESVTESINVVITKKINEFFKTQFELLKLNNMMRNINSPTNQGQTDGSPKPNCEDAQNPKANKNSKNKNQQSSSNNSNEIDSNSGSNSDLKKEGKSAVSETRKGGKKLPRYASNMLKEWFCDHIDDPYPTKEEKIMLASKTNLSLRQITNWFVNHRGRKWKEKKRRKKFSSQVKSKLMIEGLNQQIADQQSNNS